jgi:hypothetical protein
MATLRLIVSRKARHRPRAYPPNINLSRSRDLLRMGDTALMSLVRKVRCEARGTLNRVPRYSIRRVPHCGGCDSNLPALTPTVYLRTPGTRSRRALNRSADVATVVC